MTTAILLVLALLIGLPILVKLIEKFSTKFMLKVSEMEGFWDFMTGQMRLTPPAKKIECPVTKGGHALMSDGGKIINSWDGSNIVPKTQSVKLTEDWELPTLERELAEEKRWGDGLLEGELEKN